MNFKISIIVVIFLLFLCSVSGHTGEKNRVLILNSYHKGYAWTDSLLDGIEQTLAKQIKDPVIYVEYMDTKRINTSEYRRKIFQLLEIKYFKKNLDVVIVSDDNAFQFIDWYFIRGFREDI